MLKFVILLLVVYVLTVEKQGPRSTLSHKRAVRLKHLTEQLHVLYERSRREQKSFLGPALSLSNRIKEEYPEYDWSSHTLLLKRIAEPYKSEPPIAYREGV